jgi:exopolysaccharide biosynthesis polyprenyl glycosylphosphotransferase
MQSAGKTVISFCNLYLPSRLFYFIIFDAAFLSISLLAALNAGDLTTLIGWRLVAAALSGGLVCLSCLYIFDLYDLDLTRSVSRVMLQGLRAMGCGILLLAPIWSLLVPFGPRYALLEGSLIVFILILCLYRLVVDWVHSRLLSGERVLLVGDAPSISLLATAMAEKKCLPLRMSGVISESPEYKVKELDFATCGHMGELDALIRSFRPDRIAVGVERGGAQIPAKELVDLRRRGIRVDDAAVLYEAISGRVPVSMIDHDALAYGKGFSVLPVTAALYRAVGFFLAVIFLILLSPLILLLIALIKLDSKGPVFFQQERVGLHGQNFFVYKFRSMRVDAESLSGPVWATENDPRVTRIGRILRKLRLDELPQLWNVMRGEMAFVGPRPERPHFVEMLEQHIPYYALRHSVPPGITGWAQVCASYGSDIAESRVKLEFDLFYLKNQSPLFDGLVMLKTVKIALFGRGAR